MMQGSFISICLRVDEVGDRAASVERDGGGREEGETDFHFVLVELLVAA